MMAKKKRSRKKKGRGRRRNPARASARVSAKSLFAGFQPKVLTQAGLMTVGIIGNIMMTGLVTSKLPIPTFFKGGIGRNLLGLVNAGVIGAAAGALGAGGRRAAPMIFSGAVVQVVGDLAKQYLPQVMGMAGIGDYLTTQQESLATPIDASVAGYQTQRLGNQGDYLTTEQESAATPIDRSVAGLMGFTDMNAGTLM